jgi:RNA polymerase sigma-70 factor (ECF subfamily)
LATFGEKLVEEYFERVRNYVRVRVPPQDCADVVSEVFVRALQKKDQLKGAPGPWLFAIAKSRIADHFRQKETLTSMTESVTLSPPQPAGSQPALAPLERLEHAEFRALLQRKLNHLSELEREAIALKFTDGLSNIQIAEMLQITPGHLGVVLHRALRQLRDSMLQEVR